MTTTLRSAVLSGTQLSSYDWSKNNLLNKHYSHIFPADSFRLHLVSSIFAGLMTTLASNPFDIARTRIMNEKLQMVNGGIKSNYSPNPFITMLKIVREEGFMSLYKGFVPSYIRLSFCTSVFFIIYEELRSIVGFSGI